MAPMRKASRKAQSAEPAPGRGAAGLRAGIALDPEDQAVSLGEATYRALCRALRNGLIKAGDRLREEDVAAVLAVSRTPVREAFGRLLEKRLVEPVGGRGLVVRRLEASEIIELYALREILEGSAARLAAQYASETEVAIMRDTEAALERARDDAGEMGRLNRALHDAILRAARNRYLTAALGDLQDSLALLGPTTFGVAGRPDAAFREHRAIISAIADRDADAAERAAREHMRTSLQARARMSHFGGA